MRAGGLSEIRPERPGWDLTVELDAAIPQLAITGTGERPALPGPSPLEVAYLERPAVVNLERMQGSLAVVRSELQLRELGQGKVQLTGVLHTAWRALGDAVTCDYAIELDLEAALVT